MFLHREKELQYLNEQYQSNKFEFWEVFLMAKIKITITDSKCRSGYLKKGQEFIIEDLAIIV